MDHKCVIVVLNGLRDFSLKGEPRSGHGHLHVNDEDLSSMIRANPTFTSTEDSFKYEIHQNTVLDYIKRIGFVSVWVPHELKEKNLMDSISIYSSNLPRDKMELFFDHLGTTRCVN
ncbi:hypothetical protein TNCV_429491 [Trichonephila clavipes]|nr:hypothetical protein TNCV_429491 [Trichonephila clavipes]